MMFDTFLSWLIFFPLLGAIMILAFARAAAAEAAAQNARLFALWISGVTFAASLYLLWHFDFNYGGMQFMWDVGWIERYNIRYTIGVDGISLPLILLTAALTPLCILVSWHSVQQRVPLFMASLLALESFVIGVFCALDFVLFYVFWEAMLIPMFLLIGIWGGENRVYAAVKFFLYTFVGSVLMLVAILYMYAVSPADFSILQLAGASFSAEQQFWLFLAFFAAFAVKVPMWPFHTWLPDAHVQAPTAGSVILAGILLKMGTYGFLRISLPLFPQATELFAPLMFTLSAIAIIYAALVAFAQTDIKKMIAYSSVSHMGFVTLGIFALTPESVQGAVLQMVNHGIVSAALFMLIGVIYDRMHTRELTRFGGVANTMPVYAAVFMVFTMASVALPGTNSFVGEFLILMGSYSVAQIATVAAMAGVVLGAVYMLWLYRKMIFGPADNVEVRTLHDLTVREKLMFVPLVLLVLWIGLAPQYALDMSRKSIESLVESHTMSTAIQLAQQEGTVK